MSLFANLYSHKNYNIFTEIEVDGNQVQDQDQPTDYTSPEAQTPPANEAPQDATEQQPQEQQPEQNPDQGTEPAQPEDQEPPMDYTQASDTDMASQGGETGTQDDGTSAQSGASREESEVDDIKTREEEIFNLTQEELDVKHDELKKRYLDMFDITTDVIERIGDVTVTEQNMEVIEYVTNNLNSIREMLTDYMNSIYKTKSYIENSINYNRFLAVLNGIQKMLEEIVIKED